MKKICPHDIINHISEGEDLGWTREELKSALVKYSKWQHGQTKMWLARHDTLIDMVRKSLVLKVTHSKGKVPKSCRIEHIKTDAIAKAAKDSREIKS